MVIQSFDAGAGGTGYRFFCPGCGMHHHVVDSVWDVRVCNGKPTFWPAVLVLVQPPGERETRCHFKVTAGVLEYLPDSTHKLSGWQVPMVELDCKN